MCRSLGARKSATSWTAWPGSWPDKRHFWQSAVKKLYDSKKNGVDIAPEETAAQIERFEAELKKVREKVGQREKAVRDNAVDDYGKALAKVADGNVEAVDNLVADLENLADEFRKQAEKSSGQEQEGLRKKAARHDLLARNLASEAESIKSTGLTWDEGIAADQESSGKAFAKSKAADEQKLSGMAGSQRLNASAGFAASRAGGDSWADSRDKLEAEARAYLAPRMEEMGTFTEKEIEDYIKSFVDTTTSSYEVAVRKIAGDRQISIPEAEKIHADQLQEQRVAADPEMQRARKHGQALFGANEHRSLANYAGLRTQSGMDDTQATAAVEADAHNALRSKLKGLGYTDREIELYVKKYAKGISESFQTAVEKVASEQGVGMAEAERIVYQRLKDEFTHARGHLTELEMIARKGDRIAQAAGEALGQTPNAAEYLARRMMEMRTARRFGGAGMNEGQAIATAGNEAFQYARKSRFLGAWGSTRRTPPSSPSKPWPRPRRWLSRGWSRRSRG